MNTQSDQAVSSAAQCGQGWNDWLRAHVVYALEEFSGGLNEAIGEALAEERHLHRREREKELAFLRREIADLQGQVKVLLTLLQGAKTADVVSLGGRKPSAG